MASSSGVDVDAARLLGEVRRNAHLVGAVQRQYGVFETSHMRHAVLMWPPVGAFCTYLKLLL